MKVRTKVKAKVRTRKIAVIIIGIMVAVLASGCNDSMQTDEEIVVSRQEGEGQGAEASGGQESRPDDRNADAQDIAKQVQAPESYEWEGNNENISVKVNAPVMVPEGEGFKTYRVTARTYTQEDYDQVSQILLKGASLWERDYEQMENSHGFTRKEIEEKIERFETNKAAGGKYEDMGKEKTYDEIIEEWAVLIEDAPEEPVIKEVPAVISYTEGEEYYEENLLTAYATVEGQDYFVSVDNNLKEDWRWVTFEITADRGNASFMPLGEGEEAFVEADKFPADELKEEAEKMIADMGFTEFTAAGEEYFRTYSWNEETDALSEDGRDGYGIHFTRVLDGIPVTYTYSNGTIIEDGVISAWPYETLDVIYDGEGIANFKWINPYNIEKMSDETVFLIPFSDIQSIFEEMILKKYGDFFENYDAEVSFEINEVRLGYMRVMEKGNVMEGTMIPVWDFFGSESIVYKDGSESYTYGGSYASWLTINALDGTVIDRDLGY